MKLKNEHLDFELNSISQLFGMSNNNFTTTYDPETQVVKMPKVFVIDGYFSANLQFNDRGVFRVIADSFKPWLED